MVVASAGGLVPVLFAPAACAKHRPSFLGLIIVMMFLWSLLQFVYAWFQISGTGQQLLDRNFRSLPAIFQSWPGQYT